MDRQRGCGQTRRGLIRARGDTMQELDVFFRECGPGWQPIDHLAHVAADVFGTRVVPLMSPQQSKLNLFRNTVLAPGKARRAKRSALIMAIDPYDIVRFFREPGRARNYNEVVVYICDSFYWRGFNRFSIFKHVDLVVRMRPFDQDIYEKHLGNRTIYAPFGADVLGLGGWQGTRDIDVLRVGRQPDEWDDDAESGARVEAAGLRFHGRPPQVEDAGEGMRLLFDYYRRSKLTLAHSNLISAHVGTHTSLDYITARWTDAAANGTIVAGHQPTLDRGLTEMLWPEMLVYFDSRDARENIEQLSEAQSNWTPEIARHNYLTALKRLDWRWRLQDIAAFMGWSAPGLDAAVAAVSQRIKEEETAQA